MTEKEIIKVLIVEDKEDLADDAKREIEDCFDEDQTIEVCVTIQNDFDEGVKEIRKGGIDVVVLDVRRDPTESETCGDEEAGANVYHDIRSICFATVIFWTALPGSVAQYEMPPIVSVVPKDEMNQLPDKIRSAIDGRAVKIIKEIEQDIKDTIRDHMWQELAPNWDEYAESSDNNISQVLISRLARKLEDDRNSTLTSPFTAHPSHRYLYPTLSKQPMPGDILKEGENIWWVVLTPACDLVQKKADFVLLAHANALELHPKYCSWRKKCARKKERGEFKDSAKQEWNELFKDVLKATRGRYFYLPKFRDIPDLVIDLEDVKSTKLDKLQSYDSIATLSSPFAEALLIQYSQYRGRIGVPDLSEDIVHERLFQALSTND